MIIANRRFQCQEHRHNYQKRATNHRRRQRSGRCSGAAVVGGPVSGWRPSEPDAGNALSQDDDGTIQFVYHLLHDQKRQHPFLQAVIGDRRGGETQLLLSSTRALRLGCGIINISTFATFEPDPLWPGAGSLIAGFVASLRRGRLYDPAKPAGRRPVNPLCLTAWHQGARPPKPVPPKGRPGS